MKKSYVNFDGKNAIFEGFVLKRIQSASLSGNFDNENIQELANKGYVASVKTDETYDLSLDCFDRGNVDFLKHICRKDTSTPNSGVITESDLEKISVDAVFQTETSDGELDRADYLPNLTLTSMALNYSVDGNASENYSFQNTKRYFYLNDKKSVRLARGEFVGDSTILVPWEVAGEVEVTAEAVGTGDDSETEFTLSKAPIKANNYTIYIGGVAKTEGTDYSIDLSTGIIEFATAPSMAEAITANFITEGAEVVVLRINGKTIPSANYTLTEDEIILSGITISEEDRIVILYVPKASQQTFEEIVTDLSETAILRRGQIDIFFNRESDLEAKQLRLQSVDINLSFDKNPLNELGEEEAYDHSVNSRTVDITMNLNQSDLEMIAKATGKYAEFQAGTLTMIDMSDMVKDLVLKVKVYSSPSTKDSSTLLREIEIKRVTISNPSESVSVGAVAEESFSATADNIKITGGGNL